MEYLNRLSVKISAAIVIGFLLAGTATKITYTCNSESINGGCVSFDKAVMHPRDLLNNKQNSLVHFSETFVTTFLIGFITLSIINLTPKKKT